MSKKLSINPRKAGEQPLDPEYIAQRARLFTAYQQAFLNEIEVRKKCNLAIAELRKAEKLVRVNAVALSEFQQLEFIPLLSCEQGGVK